jgi:2-keto-4-pentenoate hydratase/2-oxohepta-3-ene-1,7-dioic acid hydratase in catechol pathway
MCFDFKILLHSTGTVGLDIFLPKTEKAKERLIRKRRETWRKVFHAGILIEPHIPELDEFKDYFNEAIKVTYNGEKLWI